MCLVHHLASHKFGCYWGTAERYDGGDKAESGKWLTLTNQASFHRDFVINYRSKPFFLTPRSGVGSNACLLRVLGCALSSKRSCGPSVQSYACRLIICGAYLPAALGSRPLLQGLLVVMGDVLGYNNMIELICHGCTACFRIGCGLVLVRVSPGIVL